MSCGNHGLDGSASTRVGKVGISSHSDSARVGKVESYPNVGVGKVEEG